MSQLSKHAFKRSCERAIPPIVIDWLISYGNRTPAGKGSEFVFFDQTARRALQRDLGWIYGRMESKLHAYAILAPDGKVITAGYRQERVKKS